jgi:hypothetical protein
MMKLVNRHPQESFARSRRMPHEPLDAPAHPLTEAPRHVAVDEERR